MTRSRAFLNKLRILPVAALLLLFVVAACTNSNQAGKPSGKVVKVTDREEDVVFGDPNAPHEIVMYASYDCKYCRKFFAGSYPDLKEKYLDTGKLKLVVKWLDFGERPEMLNALQAASCISRFGDYDKFHELLNFNPAVVYTTEFGELLADIMDRNQYIAECVVNNNNYEYLKSNLREFNENKISGTPAFVINSDIYTGYRSFDRFESVMLNEFNFNQ
ncbi:thioredoxin domain-containing protein [Mangrovibacterium diazotrophicum]|uniref:Protein-disulfide isomerase n=1 Tax=Mangrovibacterium diazotrophicum TaxID=1261403 RepID=A0A419WAB4_9BACT|nr:thioredoxin domain-containing protein [Mangrovibacterium diazotrophicum]RKD92393.1 protein-disulfide isomerase [Mangrovibacterium diazotrophicum]